ncbi:hypothetical protein J6590_036687 [Homalodisca vitripennis]|nr:hypothetical protein J6590_036687 [Homalodisca vitripennis]
MIISSLVITLVVNSNKAMTYIPNFKTLTPNIGLGYRMNYISPKQIVFTKANVYTNHLVVLQQVVYNRDAERKPLDVYKNVMKILSRIWMMSSHTPEVEGDIEIAKVFLNLPDQPVPPSEKEGQCSKWRMEGSKTM